MIWKFPSSGRRNPFHFCLHHLFCFGRANLYLEHKVYSPLAVRELWFPSLLVAQRHDTPLFESYSPQLNCSTTVRKCSLAGVEFSPPLHMFFLNSHRCSLPSLYPPLPGAKREARVPLYISSITVCFIFLNGPRLSLPSLNVAPGRSPTYHGGLFFFLQPTFPGEKFRP